MPGGDLEILVFNITNRVTLMANNKYLPYDRIGNAYTPFVHC